MPVVSVTKMVWIGALGGLVACGHVTAGDVDGSRPLSSTPPVPALTTATPATTEPLSPTSPATARPPATTTRVGPLTPSDPGRIGTTDADAIDRLAATSADAPARPHGHEAAYDAFEYPLFTGEQAILESQWLRARASTSRIDTREEAARLGYVRAAAPGSGVGTHWVLWTQIARPFDPARPAMLLFDERREPASLVGYSYWLQSDQVPDGFAGPFDEWHQHNGYCVVNGWVDRENVASAEQCAGRFLAGGDLWMLHAWVVPGFPNPNGRFAVFHPALCPSSSSGPDIARCPTN
jgi:hypothetical protein